MESLRALILLFAFCVVALNASPVGILAEFEERAKVVKTLYAKYQAMIQSQDREEAVTDFLSSYNETNMLTYRWMATLLTSTSDEPAMSLVAAAFKQHPNDLDKAMVIIKEAQEVFNLAAQVKEVYLIKSKQPRAVVSAFVDAVRRDSGLIESTIKQKVKEHKENRSWEDEFLRDITAFVDKYRSTPDIHRRAVIYLKQKYPFRAWLAVRHAPIMPFALPRKLCLQSQPSARLYLDRPAGTSQLYIVHADKTPVAANTRHAQTLLSRVADSKWTGLHCERYGETIYREMQYTCGAAKVKHALVSVLYAYHKDDVQYATSHPALLVKKIVKRRLWPLCTTKYHLFVFA